MTEQRSQEQQEKMKRQREIEQARIRRRMARVKHKILVLSGKGGVGKSTVSVNLAVSLALSGKRVGLLDIDIHGPSIPKILNLEDAKISSDGKNLLPVEMRNNLKVMSIGFLLQERDLAVIWRGPRKYHLIKQFLQDVQWGDLDYLVIDSPPGTGDEPISIAQLLEDADGAVIVTTPQEIALSDVRKCITFCRNLKLPVLGVMENMSGFVCPQCGRRTDIFNTGGGQIMAAEMGVPFLGRVPIDPQIVEACDSGKPFIYHFRQTKTAENFQKIMNPILELDRQNQHSPENKSLHSGGKKMRIAVPLAQGKLSLHFGHCDRFAIFDIDENLNKVIHTENAEPASRAPGMLPKWLSDNNVNVVIAGGMGRRAQQLLAENNIQVIIGAASGSPEELVAAYLEDRLRTGENICDH